MMCHVCSQLSRVSPQRNVVRDLGAPSWGLWKLQWVPCTGSLRSLPPPATTEEERKRKGGVNGLSFFRDPSRRSGSGRHAPLPGFLAVAAAHAAAAPVAPILGEQREPKEERAGARFNKKPPSSPVEGPAANLTQHGTQTPETLFGFEGVPTRSAVGRSAGCSPALGRSHPRSPPSRSPEVSTPSLREALPFRRAAWASAPERASRTPGQASQAKPQPS